MSLPPYPERALATLLRSTEPSSCVAAWTVWFNRKAADADRRAVQARQNAERYAAEVDAGIRRAVGSVPANGVRVTAAMVLTWIDEKGPAFFGLRRRPDIEKVRAVIVAMESQRHAALLSAWWPGCADSGS